MEGLYGRSQLPNLHNERAWLHHELNVYLWNEPTKWQGDMTRMGRQQQGEKMDNT